MTLVPARQNLLLAGTSGSGKSTLATGLLERLGEQGYQLCVIDPEGDYESFPQAIVLGTARDGPSLTEILTALANPNNHVVVNLVGLPIQDRPAFFLGLLPKLQELRAKTGRPHWVLVDETHHLLPTDGNPTALALAKELAGMVYVTVHPDQVESAILERVNMVFALGKSPDKTIQTYCSAIRQLAPAIPDSDLEAGRAVMWNRTSQESPFLLEIAPSTTERRRHRRKYAEGELPPDRSFYFKGPTNSLNLRAQNLLLFMQLGEGVDEATWLHHLHAHDYSAWIMEAIKDDVLAQSVRHIEDQSKVSVKESRQLIRAAIEDRYTLPTGGQDHAMELHPSNR